MAYTPPPVLADLADITPDTVWNTYIRDNFAVSAAGLATASGGLIVATGAAAAAMQAKGTDRQVLETDAAQAAGVKNSWGFIPIGGIIMWSGLLTSLPANWQLCDGTNGTIDLRNKFVIGAGGSYSVGDNGGSNTPSLAHTHATSGLAQTAGAHTHTMGTSGAGAAHNHTATTGAPSATNTYSADSGYNTAAGTHTHALTVDNESAHTHTVPTTNSAGGHTHDLSTDSQLSAAQDIRPPYYSLAYIQRLS